MIDMTFEKAEASLKIGDAFGWKLRAGSIEHISTLGYDDEKDFLAYIANWKGGKWSVSLGTGIHSMKIPHWSIVGEYTGTIVYYNGYVVTYYDPNDIPSYMNPKEESDDYDWYYYDDLLHQHWDDDDCADEDYGLDDHNEDYGWWR